MAAFLIAGGASGSGGAACRAFRRRGDDVVLLDVDAGRQVGEQGMAGGEGAAGRLEVLDGDPADPAAAGRAVAVCRARFGRLDGLYVGLQRATAKPLGAWTAADFDAEIAFGLTAPFFLAQAAAPLLGEAGGAIVLGSSTAGLRGSAGTAPFRAAKAGLLGLCRSLAAALAARRVRVNCILPGWIDTAFGRGGAVAEDIALGIPLRRLGRASEVADVVVFLAGAASAPLTGTAWVVDGGATAV